MGQLFLEGCVLPSFFVTPAKVPFAGSHGHLDATADLDKLNELAVQFRGAKLVAVACGAISGIDILDIDPRRGGDRWYFEHSDQFPKTRIHETRGGGWHLIFNHSPGLRTSVDRIAKGVEFLSTGRWVVWWPEHAGRVLCAGPVAPLPAWLHEALSAELVSNGHATPWKGGPQMSGGSAGRIPKPLYNEVLRLVPLSETVTRHHQRRVIGILSTVTSRCEGRNGGLNVAAFCFRELIEAGVVSREAAKRLLFGAAQACGYVAKDGERAAIRTIHSGLGSAICGPPLFLGAQE